MPNELKDLSSRNGLEVRHASFHSDVGGLIRRPKGQMGRGLPEGQRENAITGRDEDRELADSRYTMVCEALDPIVIDASRRKWLELSPNFGDGRDQAAAA